MRGETGGKVIEGFGDQDKESVKDTGVHQKPVGGLQMKSCNLCDEYMILAVEFWIEMRGPKCNNGQPNNRKLQ